MTSALVDDGSHTTFLGGRRRAPRIVVALLIVVGFAMFVYSVASLVSGAYLKGATSLLMAVMFWGVSRASRESVVIVGDTSTLSVFRFDEIDQVVEIDDVLNIRLGMGADKDEFVIACENSRVLRLNDTDFAQGERVPFVQYLVEVTNCPILVDGGYHPYVPLERRAVNSQTFYPEQ